jgi:hypothetical protein
MKELSHIVLSKNGIVKNGKTSTLPQGTFKEIGRYLYQKLGSSYPKFFKMDAPSKLAFLATELLIEGIIDSSELAGDDVGLIFGTKSGCMQSDIQHQQSLVDNEHFFPSPSVFVYTLPNIMLGEVCIRHKIQGEATCLMMDKLDNKLMFKYASDLINRENYRYCIAGWIDALNDQFSAELTLFGK